ncbi:MAG: serine/threonine protein kinase [Candidatus Sericytochromatia bacterium]
MKIAQYDILGELGRGGMGVVYDAIDPRLDRHVAIKVIELPNDPNMNNATRLELIERFKREAKASARLNHPNIVSIFDFGEYEGRYYMVMEFLQGRNLAELLKIHTPLALPVALKALIQTAEALDFAHHQGIIHRDIKPANIVILDNGTTKLADFGIARLEASNSDLTKAGSILGSLLYISPEQLMNPKDVDKRADIYSLGVTGYEILTGKLPYNGSNIGEIVMKIMQSEPPMLSELNREIPSELDSMIFKAMAKTADARYDTAKDFALDLSAVLQRLPGIPMGETVPGMVYDISQDRARGVESVQHADDTNQATQYGSSTASMAPSTGGSTLSTGSLTYGSGAVRSKEYTLLQGVDEPTAYAGILRMLRDWNVENMTTNTMLDAIYKYEGKSQGLIINNSVILLIYKGLIVGAVSKNSDMVGQDAYKLMASWQKFEMTQCIPLEKDEPWLVLMAIMSGAHTLLEENPMASQGEVSKLIEQQKARNFSGMLRIQQRKQIRWLGLLDGVQVFSLALPFPAGAHDAEFADVKIYAPRMNLVGPSLRKLLVEAQLQITSKSGNRPTLSQFTGAREKALTPETLEEALRNTDLTPVIPDTHNRVYQIGNRQIKHADILRETNHYKVADWLIYEYMYAFSRSGSFAKLKPRFNWIWQFKTLKFIQPVKMGSFSTTFDVLAYNSSDHIVALCRIESAITDESLQNLITDIRRIKEERPQDDVQAGILVSLHPLDDGVRQRFQQLTSKSGNLPFLNFADPAKGYVKTGWNKGFYIYLAEISGGSVKMAEPGLPIDA